MKHTFLFILMFGCFGKLATAQKAENPKRILTASMKIIFGKSPDCDAGKGVCNLIADNVNELEPNQIRGYASLNNLDTTIIIKIKLIDFRQRDPINAKEFLDDGNFPTKPQIFSYCSFIDSSLRNKLPFLYDRPGFNTGDSYIITIDGDYIKMVCKYSELLSCDNTF